MAETIIAPDLAIKRYRKKFFGEYVRASRFMPYMGPSETNIIVVMKDLSAGAGDEIIVPFVDEIEGSGVSGTQVLKGNEAVLNTASMRLRVNWRRQGVVVVKAEQSKSDLDLLEAARPRLRTWFSNRMREDIIRELNAITAYTAGTADEPDVQLSIPYATATEAQKDAWLALNADRVLFGSVVGNNASNDHSAALATVDATNDRATASMLLKAKRLAEDAKVTPYTTADGEEWFVAFVGTRAFRDLEEDADIKEANKFAAERGVTTNPLFVGGDLVYRGIIMRKEHETPVYAGVGASGADVSPISLCGQGAVAAAWGQEPAPKTQMDDYGFRSGIGMEELVGTKKISKRGVQRGLVTVYAAAPADA